jgi:hypothetical protein
MRDKVGVTTYESMTKYTSACIWAALGFLPGWCPRLVLPRPECRPHAPASSPAARSLCKPAGAHAEAGLAPCVRGICRVHIPRPAPSQRGVLLAVCPGHALPCAGVPSVAQRTRCRCWWQQRRLFLGQCFAGAGPSRRVRAAGSVRRRRAVLARAGFPTSALAQRPAAYPATAASILMMMQLADVCVGEGRLPGCLVALLSPRGGQPDISGCILAAEPALQS